MPSAEHPLSSTAQGESGRFLDRLASSPLLPVLRLPTASAAADAAARCIEAGVDVVELTTTTPNWLSALREVRAAFPNQLVGMGTVLSSDQAQDALDAGADFLVSPCPIPQVRITLPPNTVLLEGGFTVGEVLDSASRGAAKLFPAHVGGVSYLRSILAVSPQAKIVPTGGISLGSAREWLSAGALAVGVGSDLLRRHDLAEAIRSALAAGAR